MKREDYNQNKCDDNMSYIFDNCMNAEEVEMREDYYYGKKHKQINFNVYFVTINRRMYTESRKKLGKKFAFGTVEAVDVTLWEHIKGWGPTLRFKLVEKKFHKRV